MHVVAAQDGAQVSRDLVGRCRDGVQVGAGLDRGGQAGHEVAAFVQDLARGGTNARGGGEHVSGGLSDGAGGCPELAARA